MLTFSFWTYHHLCQIFYLTRIAAHNKNPKKRQLASIKMKLFSQLFVLGLAAEATVASSWFSKAGMFLKLSFLLSYHFLTVRAHIKALKALNIYILSCCCSSWKTDALVFHHVISRFILHPPNTCQGICWQLANTPLHSLQQMARNWAREMAVR
jgi:hypothetical protein